jgi:hypothetical protein
MLQHKAALNPFPSLFLVIGAYQLMSVKATQHISPVCSNTEELKRVRGMGSMLLTVQIWISMRTIKKSLKIPKG